MKRLAPGIACLLVGCHACDPPQDSVVDVPTTIAAAKALHAPPDIVVTVERKKKESTGGGGGCGHSGLCVLILPVVLLAPLFPEKWDELRITRNGSAYYEGRFTTDGRFIEAVVKEDGVARSVGVLMLDRLGRQVIVEVARAPVGADGEPGTYVRSKILPQIDLTKDYTEKLRTLRQDAERSDLLLEYARWLGAESQPWLSAVTPSEPPASLGHVLDELCTDRPSREETCEVVLDAIAAEPKPVTAVIALAESASRAQLADGAVMKASTERTLRLGRYLVDVGCKEDAAVAMDGLRHLRVSPRTPAPTDAVATELVAASHACATPRRVHLLAALGQTVDEREATVALTPRTAESEQLARLLDGGEPAHRRALVAAARARGEQKVDDVELIEALSWSRLPPDEGELTVLAKSFVRAEGERTSRRRACVIARIDAAARANVSIDALATSLRSASSSAPERDAPVYAAAKIHLGELEQASLAATAFQGAIHVPHACRDVTDDSSLTGYALFLAGCEPSEALALQDRAKPRAADAGAAPAPAPDRLCTKPLAERKR